MESLECHVCSSAREFSFFLSSSKIPFTPIYTKSFGGAFAAPRRSAAMKVGVPVHSRCSVGAFEKRPRSLELSRSGEEGWSHRVNHGRWAHSGRRSMVAKHSASRWLSLEQIMRWI